MLSDPLRCRVRLGPRCPALPPPHSAPRLAQAPGELPQVRTRARPTRSPGARSRLDCSTCSYITRRRCPNHLIYPERTACKHHHPIEAQRHTACLRHHSHRRQKLLVQRVAFAITPVLFVHGLRESKALLARVSQFAEAVGEFDPAGIDLEAFGHPRITWFDPGQCPLRCRILEQDSQSALPQVGFDMLHEYLAENIRPCVVLTDPYPLPGRCRQSIPIATAVHHGCEQIEPREALERGGDRH